MSTISITFVAIGDNALNGGYVDIGFNDNVIVTQLKLTSKEGPSISQYFSAIPTGIPTDEDTAQAQAYAYSFNRDFKNVGGTNNLTASTVDNVVTITAIIGTFDTFVETGNFATNSGIVNSTQVVPLVLTVTRNATVGDCTNIQYSATATGGTAPYTLNDGFSDIETGWNGSSTTFNLARANMVGKVTVTDNVAAIESTTFPIPRKLEPGDFSISTTNFETSSDIQVVRETVISGTEPLEYSLDDIAEVTGQAYQTSNVFAGVARDQYNLFIKDAYGCEILKVIDITGFQDTTAAEKVRYFNIPEGQSIIFSEYPDFDPYVKKNYFNTRSQNENKYTNYAIVHNFDPNDDPIGTQFKSSYDYHNITLYGCDGSTFGIQPIMIQENLGSTEKMDCVLFPLESDTSKTGVYFQGGNTYVPDTTTQLGSSIYNGSTPSWAIVGQLVFIDGLGGFYIESTGYDNTRGGYFVLDFVTATEGANKVQVTYNIQDYNLWEFYFSPQDMPDKGFIIIEKGFTDQAIDGDTWVSELIQLKDDYEDQLLFQWYDSKNKGSIVYQSGITFHARIEGEITADWNLAAESTDGDDRQYSIEQKMNLEFEVALYGIPTKQVTQLNVGSAIETFKVNNLLLVRKSPPEIARADKSNLYTWKCKFGYGANFVGIQQDEIVLSVETGVVGGGGTGKDASYDLTGITLTRLSDGTIVKTYDDLVHL